MLNDFNNSAYYIDKILNSKINKIKSDFVTKKRRNCLQYKIKWTKYENNNALSEWYDFVNVVDASNAVTDFHYRYSNKSKSHATFKRSDDWKSFSANDLWKSTLQSCLEWYQHLQSNKVICWNKSHARTVNSAQIDTLVTLNLVEHKEHNRQRIAHNTSDLTKEQLTSQKLVDV